ncbi:PREDICTED: umecyanin-like [Fragaria vesca subsp. vesca]|uniref:umecyanin-like n=1 Tax=Fragaria vesca subsp. vesca TaxID=101020 RepID=UPI0002C36C44|nr:PREDICTED: umecyanin-like [Fragaria vesca subsp. vesca]
MASFRNKNTNTNMLACLSLMVVMVGLMKGATAVEYVVGDSLGWTLPPNTSLYSDWAASKTFQLGDRVFFNWTGNHNVALPTKEQYDNCSDLQSNLGSPVSVELTAGSNYYFCTVGDHCKARR